MVNFKAIGTIVCNARGAMNPPWSRERLAAEAGVSLKTVINVEFGRDVNLKTVDRIARAIGTSLPDLLIESEKAE